MPGDDADDHGEDGDNQHCPLTSEVVQAHLGVLGKNPYTLLHVYTTASLANLGLTDLEVMGEFPNVQHVHCQQNRLRSLSPLQHLRLLLSVDASHNELTRVLDFDIPKCTHETPWVGGDEWIGSLLRRADLSHNRISVIRELRVAHPFLQELRLAHNDIKEITGISALRFLRVLDLSYNRLTSTKGLLPRGFLDDPEIAEREPRPEALEVLILHHNHISTVDEVVGLARLVHLDVSYNKLRDLSKLEHCYRLQVLDVSHNELASVNQLNYLMPLPFLQKLALVGCPLVSCEDSVVFYRARVLRRLQQLVELDGEDVSAKEKIKALVMHGSDVKSRRSVLEEHLPSEQFVNYLPPLDFEDDQELVRFYEDRYGLLSAGGDGASGEA